MGMGCEKYERTPHSSITLRITPFGGRRGMKMLLTARRRLIYILTKKLEQIRLPIDDHARVVEGG